MHSFQIVQQFAWLEKLLTGAFFGLLVLVLTPLFPIFVLSNETYQQNASLVGFMGHMFVSTLCARFKYYFAWKMSESHLNCCGFGFNGFDEQTGKSKWNLVSTIDILSFEVFI